MNTNIYRYIIIVFLVFSLLACQPMPGGDSDIHRHISESSGKATITKVYKLKNEYYIDFKWSKDNHNKHSIITNVKFKDIINMSNTVVFNKGDEVILRLTETYKQLGSTTSELVETYWILEK